MTHAFAPFGADQLAAPAPATGPARAGRRRLDPPGGDSPRMFVLGYRATPATLATGARALASIWYPWRELLGNWSLRFLPAKPGYLGRTLWPDRVIEIYVRPGQDIAEVSFALAHEFGHAVDLEHFDPAARARWREARGLGRDIAWFGESDANDFATPAGDWAESFAAWQVGAEHFQSHLGPAPTDTQLQTLQSLALAGWRAGNPAADGASPAAGIAVGNGTKDLQVAG